MNPSERGVESEALSWQDVKNAGSRVFHGAVDAAHAAAPLVSDGLKIVQALRPLPNARDLDLSARELE